LLLENGFDLHGIGKLPFSLGVWDRSGHRFQTLRTNWQCSGRYTATACSTGKAVWVNYLQNDANGGHDGCVSTYGRTAIQTNTWYHFHQEVILTDPTHPVAKIWIQGPADLGPVLVFNCTWNPPSGSIDTDHNIQIAHTSWFGGAGNKDKAQNPSYSLEANVHIYSGAPQ
jgi:hypothetical protein